MPGSGSGGRGRGGGRGGGGSRGGGYSRSKRGRSYSREDGRSDRRRRSLYSDSRTPPPVRGRDRSTRSYSTDRRKRRSPSSSYDRSVDSRRRRSSSSSYGRDSRRKKGGSRNNTRGGGRGRQNNISRRDSSRSLSYRDDRRRRSSTPPRRRDRSSLTRGKNQRSSYAKKKQDACTSGRKKQRSASSTKRRSPSSERSKSRSSEEDEDSEKFFSDDESSSSERDLILAYPRIGTNSYLCGQQYRVVSELGKGICARVVHAVEGAYMQPDKAMGPGGIVKQFLGQRDVALKVFRGTGIYSRAAFEEYQFLVDLMTKTSTQQAPVPQFNPNTGLTEQVSTVYCDLSIAEQKHFLAPLRFHFAPDPKQQLELDAQRRKVAVERRKANGGGKKSKDGKSGSSKKSGSLMGTTDQQLLKDTLAKLAPDGTNCAIITFPLCGPSLFAMLEARRMIGFPLHAVRNILFQLFTCLAHCEEQDVMHTDVKPENILLTCRTKKEVRTDHRLVIAAQSPTRTKSAPIVAEPTIVEPQHWGVVLADFGNACHPSKMTKGAKQEKTIQTRQYRAPEVILKCDWTSAADVWSVGCMIPELLTGECLWLAADLKEQLALYEQRLSPVSESSLKWFFSNSLIYPGKYSYGVDGKGFKVPLCEAHRYFTEDPSRKRGYKLLWPDDNTKTKDLTFVNGADTIEQIVEKVVFGHSSSKTTTTAGGKNIFGSALQSGSGANSSNSKSSSAGKDKKDPVLAETAKNLENLIFRCLTYNPTKRITATEALNHPFFTETSF